MKRLSIKLLNDYNVSIKWFLITLNSAPAVFDMNGRIANVLKAPKKILILIIQTLNLVRCICVFRKSIQKFLNTVQCKHKSFRIQSIKATFVGRIIFSEIFVNGLLGNWLK